MLTFLTALACLTSLSAAPPRERIDFDHNWKFALGNASDPKRDFEFGYGGAFLKAGQGEGALGNAFDDSEWRPVTIPHDWAIEVPFDGKNTEGLHTAHGSRSVGPSYPASSIGWYRKHFKVDASDLGRRVSFAFDGVFRDSQVWLNGHLMGRNLSGYAPFQFDVTDFLNYGGDNVLVVRADASHPEGWFYEGAGIYRHVWMIKTNPVHVNPDDVYLVPTVTGTQGHLAATIAVQNESDTLVQANVDVTVYDEHNAKVGHVAAPCEAGADAVGTIKTELSVDSIKLWDIGAPHLYRAEVQVSVGGKVVDAYSTSIGFRTIVFDKDKGFFLNGRSVKIKGACNHQDHAGVGAAIPDRLQEFRIEKLQEFGFNAYRTSHNAPTPELLDACDRKGMLVLDENRILGSSGEVLSQLSRLVKRDRNRPCVIAWSICNEENEQDSDRGARMAASMVKLVRKLDPTRLTTAACNDGGNDQGLHQVVDIRGFNYSIGAIDAYRKKHPNQPLWGSEVASTLSTRGIYTNDADRGYVAAYDVNKPGWGALAEEWWSFTDEREWLSGGFVWTGFDYRGEPTPYAWPCISSHFGVLDTCGFPKDLAYYYQAWWTDKPVLHLLPHWNWAGKEGKPIDVWCFSNHEEIELLVNGKSQGRKPMPKNGHVQWTVAYEPGALEARGYRKGKVVQTERVETSGPAAQIILTPDRREIAADGKDVAIYTVSAVDAQGRPVPTADDNITFDVEGPGRIIGVGNGDPSCKEPDRYLANPNSTNVTGWKRMPVAKDKELPTNDAGLVPVAGDDLLKQPSNSVYYYRADVNVATVPKSLEFLVSRADDHGWIYVNGKMAGEIKTWNESFRIEASGLFHAGTNRIEIIVNNGYGEGGIGRVSLSSPGEEPRWSRSLFNGLAQVIVQSTGQAGSIIVNSHSGTLKAGSTTIKSH